MTLVIVPVRSTETRQVVAFRLVDADTNRVLVESTDEYTVRCAMGARRKG